jgi:hypothetical protein
MSASQFQAQPVTNATITATGATGAFPLNQNFNSVLCEIEIGAAPTGTSPTITFQLQVSLDGSNYENFGSATSSLTAAGITALSNTNVAAPLAKIAYTVGGTTPSFTAVTVNVYQS